MNRVHIAVFGVFLAAALLAVVALSGGPGDAAFPGVNGQIAFYDVDGDVRHIYARTPGTGFRTQLTFGDENFDQNPEYSADGSMIVFDRVLNDVRAIWTMNSDGSNQQMVPGTETGRQAAWSPDGEHIAFTRDGDIYTVHPDGSDQTQLTNDPNNLELDADWSPDGTQINLPRQLSDLCRQRRRVEPGSADQHTGPWSSQPRLVAQRRTHSL